MHHYLLMFGMLGATSLGLIATGPEEAPTTVQDVKDVRMRTMVLQGNPLNDATVGDAMNVEVIQNNDDLKVIVNGEEVPADRIEQKDGEIVVYGPDGKVLTNFRMFTGDHFGAFHFDADGFAPFAVRGDLDNVILGEVFGDLDIDFAEIAEPPSVMLGVVFGRVEPALAYHLGIEGDKATVLNEVYEGFPAANAGLKQYDIIVEVDGRRPAAPSDIRAILRERNPGDLLKVTVVQAGQPNELHIGLAARDEAKLHEAAAQSRKNTFIFGPEVEGVELRDLEWTPLRAPGEGRLRLFMPDQNEVQALLELTPDAGVAAGDARREALRARIAELEARLKSMTEEIEDR